MWKSTGHSLSHLPWRILISSEKNNADFYIHASLYRASIERMRLKLTQDFSKTCALHCEADLVPSIPYTVSTLSNWYASLLWSEGLNLGGVYVWFAICVCTDWTRLIGQPKQSDKVRNVISSWPTRNCFFPLFLAFLHHASIKAPWDTGTA